jgi:hypothetical protein
MTADDWKRRSVYETRNAVSDINTGRYHGIYLEILGNFTDETLEREFADEELSGFLVTSDFPEGDSSRAEAMGLLDTTGSCLGTEISIDRQAQPLSYLQPPSYGLMTWQRVVCGVLCLQIIHVRRGAMYQDTGCVPPVDLRAVCLVRAMM